MRRLGALSTILVAVSFATGSPALAQTKPGASDSTAPASGAPGANVSAVGRKMPPAPGRPGAGAPADARATEGKETAVKATSAKATSPKVAGANSKGANEAEMLKAQKAAEQRNKAWDSKMRKTMGSICSGC